MSRCQEEETFLLAVSAYSFREQTGRTIHGFWMGCWRPFFQCFFNRTLLQVVLIRFAVSCINICRLSKIWCRIGKNGLNQNDSNYELQKVEVWVFDSSAHRCHCLRVPVGTSIFSILEPIVSIDSLARGQVCCNGRICSLQTLVENLPSRDPILRVVSNPLRGGVSGIDNSARHPCFLVIPGDTFDKKILAPHSCISDLLAKDLIEPSATAGFQTNHFSWKPGLAVGDQWQALLACMPPGKQKQNLVKRAAKTEGFLTNLACGSDASFQFPSNTFVSSELINSSVVAKSSSASEGRLFPEGRPIPAERNNDLETSLLQEIDPPSEQVCALASVVALQPVNDESKTSKRRIEQPQEHVDWNHLVASIQSGIRVSEGEIASAIDCLTTLEPDALRTTCVLLGLKLTKTHDTGNALRKTTQTLLQEAQSLLHANRAASKSSHEAESLQEAPSLLPAQGAVSKPSHEAESLQEARSLLRVHGAVSKPSHEAESSQGTQSLLHARSASVKPSHEAESLQEAQSLLHARSAAWKPRDEAESLQETQSFLHAHSAVSKSNHEAKSCAEPLAVLVTSFVESGLNPKVHQTEIISLAGESYHTDTTAATENVEAKGPKDIDWNALASKVHARSELSSEEVALASMNVSELDVSSLRKVCQLLKVALTKKNAAGSTLRKSPAVLKDEVQKLLLAQSTDANTRHPPTIDQTPNLCEHAPTSYINLPSSNAIHKGKRTLALPQADIDWNHFVECMRSSRAISEDEIALASDCLATLEPDALRKTCVLFGLKMTKKNDKGNTLRKTTQTLLQEAQSLLHANRAASKSSHEAESLQKAPSLLPAQGAVSKPSHEAESLQEARSLLRVHGAVSKPSHEAESSQGTQGLLHARSASVKPSHEAESLQETQSLLHARSAASKPRDEAESLQEAQSFLHAHSAVSKSNHEAKSCAEPENFPTAVAKGVVPKAFSVSKTAAALTATSQSSTEQLHGMKLPDTPIAPNNRAQHYFSEESTVHQQFDFNMFAGIAHAVRHQDEVASFQVEWACDFLDSVSADEMQFCCKMLGIFETKQDGQDSRKTTAELCNEAKAVLTGSAPDNSAVVALAQAHSEFHTFPANKIAAQSKTPGKFEDKLPADITEGSAAKNTTKEQNKSLQHYFLGESVADRQFQCDIFAGIAHAVSQQEELQSFQVEWACNFLDTLPANELQACCLQLGVSVTKNAPHKTRKTMAELRGEAMNVMSRAVFEESAEIALQRLKSKFKDVCRTIGNGGFVSKQVAQRLVEHLNASSLEESPYAMGHLCSIFGLSQQHSNSKQGADLMKEIKFKISSAVQETEAAQDRWSAMFRKNACSEEAMQNAAPTDTLTQRELLVAAYRWLKNNETIVTQTKPEEIASLTANLLAATPATFLRRRSGFGKKKFRPWRALAQTPLSLRMHKETFYVPPPFVVYEMRQTVLIQVARLQVADCFAQSTLIQGGFVADCLPGTANELAEICRHKGNPSRAPFRSESNGWLLPGSHSSRFLRQLALLELDVVQYETLPHNNLELVSEIMKNREEKTNGNKAEQAKDMHDILDKYFSDVKNGCLNLQWVNCHMLLPEVRVKEATKMVANTFAKFVSFFDIDCSSWSFGQQASVALCAHHFYRSRAELPLSKWSPRIRPLPRFFGRRSVW